MHKLITMHARSYMAYAMSYDTSATIRGWLLVPGLYASRPSSRLHAHVLYQQVHAYMVQRSTAQPSALAYTRSTGPHAVGQHELFWAWRNCRCWPDWIGLQHAYDTFGTTMVL